MPKETILILDNENHIQRAWKTLLESEEFIVINVDTVEKALKNLSEFKVSGFITEYWIDQSCTIEAIRDLKKTFPETYVMVLTSGEVNENEYEEIINVGVDDFFKKPISGRKTLLHLKKGLKQRRILIQKNRLEQELNRINKRRETGGGKPQEENHPTITN